MAPFRPRLRFSLRTLLVLLAVLAAPCMYVTGQYQIVRERRMVLQMLEHRPAEEAPPHAVKSNVHVYIERPTSWLQVWLENWEDDVWFSGCSWMWLPVTPEECRRIIRAFPGSTIQPVNDHRVAETTAADSAPNESPTPPSP